MPDNGPLTEQDAADAAESRRRQKERRDAYHRHLDAYHRRLRVAQQPLLEELRSAGIVVDTVWDFVNGETPNEAVPILLEHLDHDYPYRVKEGIARSLTLRRLPALVLERLIREFKYVVSKSAKETCHDEELPDKSAASLESYKFALGIAIGYGSTKGDYETIAALARDPGNGEARYYLIHALARNNRDRAGDILVELLGQRDVLYPVLDGLAYLRDDRARPVAERLVKAAKSSDRREQNLRDVARKYLKRIGADMEQ